MNPLAPYSHVTPRVRRGPTIEQAIADAQKALEHDGPLKQLAEIPPLPIERDGSFEVIELDLAQSTFATVGPGYAFTVLREGTAPGARVTVDAGGRWDNMAPGEYFSGGYFGQLKLSRGSRSCTSGIARVLLLKSPRLVAGMLADAAGTGTLGGGIVGPNGAATQTANSPSGNEPSAAGDGVPLDGVKGLRVVVSADAGRTLSGGGTVDLWHYNARSFSGGAPRARWTLGQVSWDTASSAGLRDLILPDQLVGVPEGRVYAEADTVTVSGGALTVTIETWG